jgi:hypothetical protein
VACFSVNAGKSILTIDMQMLWLLNVWFLLSNWIREIFKYAFAFTMAGGIVRSGFGERKIVTSMPSVDLTDRASHIRKIEKVREFMANHHHHATFSRSRATRSSIPGIMRLSIAAASLFAGHSTLAATDTWLDTDGLFWNNATGWQSGVVPANGDIVNVGSHAPFIAGNVTLNFTSNLTGSGITLNTLNINSVDVGVMIFSQVLSTSSMSATTEIIGDTSGPNLYTQNAGANNAGSITLGNQTGGNGNYSLSGTGNVTAGSLNVGGSGIGSFSQSGGNVTITSFLGVGGENAGGNSTYSLSGGNLTLAISAFGTIGDVPRAAFTQTGGTFNLNGNTLHVENSTIAGNSVVYTLSNGSLINAGEEEFGGTGSGTVLFSQTGGTHSFAVGGFLDLGNSGPATYALSNGTLNTYTVFVADTANSTFTQSGGTHTVSNNLVIGNSATGVYDLIGGSLTVANETLAFFSGVVGIVNQSGGSHTVTNTLLLNNDSSYNISAGSLTIATAELGSSSGGIITFSQTGGTVSIGAFNVALSGGESSTVSLGVFSVLNVGNETLGFSGNATFRQLGSNHTVSGQLALAAGTGSSALYSMSGGNLSANALSIGAFGNANFTQSGGNVTIGTGGILLNAHGDTSLTTTYTLTGGSLSAPSTAGSFIINPGGVFTQNQIFGFSTQSGYINNYGTINYGTGTFNGPLENDSTGVVNISPGLLFLVNAGILNEGGITLLSNTSIASGSAGVFDNENNITLAGGTISGPGAIFNDGLLFGFGTISGSGNFTNNGYFSAVNGNIVFSVAGLNINAGTIALTPGHQLQFVGGITLTNNGTFTLANGLVTGSGVLFNNAAGSVVGPGTIASSFLNTGLVSPGAGTLTISNAWTNNGTIQPTGVGSVLAGGSIANNVAIQGAGTIAAAVTNLTGTIESTGGALIFTGNVINTANGTLRTNAGTKILIQGTNIFPTNAGLISLVGGTFDNGGSPLNNTGQITGFGVLSTGGLTNNGSLTFTGGTTTINGPVTNVAAHTIIAKDAPSIFTGPVTNSGTIVVTNTTVTFTNNYTGNAYISDPSTNIFQANVNVIPGGSMSGGAGDQFLFNGGAVTNAGTFTNSGLLQTSDNITNSGNFTQSGPQSWSSTAGFTNTAGKASFQSNAKLAFLTITGGTFDTTTSQLLIEPTNKLPTLAALESDIANHSLFSSTLAAHLGLAIIDNATLATPFTTFGGLPADTGSILIAPELLGDTNIDGTVNLADLNTVLADLGTSQPNWTKGNFDGAPTIDLTDLNDVLNNLGLTFANSNTVQPATPAPEPASLITLAFALPLLHRRKVRNSRISFLR